MSQIYTLPTKPVSDGEARLAAIVTEYRSALVKYATRLTAGDAAWAEDVVQEALLRAWHHLDRLVPEYGSVRSWLLRVVHNLVMDGYRAARTRPVETMLDNAPEVSVSDSTADVISKLELQQALNLLPEPHRAALTATYLCDRTAAQAARTLGVPVGTVKSRVYYGLRMLRCSLKIDDRAA